MKAKHFAHHNKFSVITLILIVLPVCVVTVRVLDAFSPVFLPSWSLSNEEKGNEDGKKNEFENCYQQSTALKNWF